MEHSIKSDEFARKIKKAAYFNKESEIKELLKIAKDEKLFSAHRYFELNHKIKKMVGSDLSSVLGAIVYAAINENKHDIYTDEDYERVGDVVFLQLVKEDITEKEAMALTAITARYINKAMSKKMKSLFFKKDKVINENGKRVRVLKKNAAEEVIKYTEAKIMKRRFNNYVLSEHYRNEAIKGNVGNPKHKPVRELAKNINGNDDNLFKYAPKNIIEIVAEEKADSIEATKKMKAGNSGRSVFDVAKKDSHKFYEHYIENNALSQLAEEKGFTWRFITTTCEGEYHSNPANGNRNFNGSSIKETDDFLNSKWITLKKRFQKPKWSHLRFGLDTGFGKRVKEPNGDGTVHYHFMLFCREDLADDYAKLFKSVFGESDLACDIIRKGFKKIEKNGRRVEVKLDGKDEASAASYIMKYVSKGLSVDFVENGVINYEKQNIEAWKKCGGIRAVSSFGFDGVKTKYNEARKINNNARQTFKEIRGKLENDREIIFNLIEKNPSLDIELAERTLFNIEKMLIMSNSLIKQVTLTSANAATDLEKIEAKEIAEIMILAEKRKVNVNGEMKWQVNYKDFMKKAIELDYEKEEFTDKRNICKSKNVGIKLKESVGGISLKL
ncbi:replication endonuclease [Vibrio parahaemolyticus]|nr:replication endonuclease [Vibrio parahaemolyticus]